MHAKFACAALHIKKALEIFRELITTTTTTTIQSGFLGPTFRVQKVNFQGIQFSIHLTLFHKVIVYDTLP